MLPRLPSDIIRAAFPESSLPKWLQKSFQNPYQSKADKNAIMSALHAMKAADPLYYNSLIDRHTKSYRTKPVVMKNLLKNGVITDDGTLRMNKNEKTEVRRAVRMIEEREAKMQLLEVRKQERTKRLKQSVYLRCAPIDGVNSPMSTSRRKVSPSLDKVPQCSCAVLAQPKSNQVGTKVPWKLFSPSTSSSTRLPSFVKASHGGSNLKETCAPAPKPAAQKVVGHDTSVVASLDPIRRAKLRGMLNEEEEALRRIIVSELQLARKAEQKAKQVQERVACREATLKAELSAEKERNRLERKRKVALQALVTECERWVKVKREKANSLNKLVELMKQRVERAIQEGNVLHFGTTKDTSATVFSNTSVATAISKKSPPAAIFSDPSVPNEPNTLATPNGAVCSSSATSMTTSLMGEPKVPSNTSTMAVSPVVVSSANTSTTDISKVPSNTASLAFALINAIPSKASSPVAHSGAHDLLLPMPAPPAHSGAHDLLLPMPAPPCISEGSAYPGDVTVEVSDESLQSTASENSEGSSDHISGEPISQMVAMPAMEIATPSPVSKIPAHISRATNTSPHLLESYIASLANFTEGKEKLASHPARTTPQSGRRCLQAVTYDVPAESQSAAVHPVPPPMQGPPIPRLRSLADVCSEVDTILAETHGNSAENLSTTSSLCTGETSMTSGGLWNGTKRCSSASDVGKGPSKLLSLSSKSCYSKHESGLQKGGHHQVSKNEGSPQQHFSHKAVRPSTPINKLQSNASSVLHRFSSSLQRIGEDPEEEYEDIPQGPCKEHGNENVPLAEFEQVPSIFTSAAKLNIHSPQDIPNLYPDGTRIDSKQSKDLNKLEKTMEASEEVTVLQVPSASGTEGNDSSRFEGSAEEALSASESQVPSVKTGEEDALKATTNEQNAFPLSMSSPCSMGHESIQSADLSKLQLSGSAPPTFRTIKIPSSFCKPGSTVPLPIFDSPQPGYAPPQFTGPQTSKGAANSQRKKLVVAKANVERDLEGVNNVNLKTASHKDALPKNSTVNMSCTPELESITNAVMKPAKRKWSCL